MKTTHAILRTIFLFSLFAVPASAQLRTGTAANSVPPRILNEIKATAGYAEVVFRKTELESTVEELLVTYKEEFPKVRHTRYELGLLNAELVRFGRLKKSDASKLTLALGKLMVRRAELATDYWILTNKYNTEHPSTKKAKRKFEIYDAAVKDIL